MKFPKTFMGTGDYDVVTGIRFVVLLDFCTIGFQSISNIESTTEYEFINEGGNNGAAYAMRKPCTTEKKLVFTKGIIMNKLSLTSILLSSFPNARDSLENSGSIGTILVLGPDREIKAIYGFISHGLLEWKLSDLNAMKPDALIETFTILHGGLKNIPVLSWF